MNKNVIHEPIQKKKDHPLRTIFLVSLIIHLLLLMMFLAVNFQKSLSNAIKVFQEKIQQLPRTELPASLKPRQSNFGTPVMFDSPPEPQEQPQEAAPKKANDDPSRDSNELLPPMPSQSSSLRRTGREAKRREIEELNKPEIFEKKEEQKHKKEAHIEEQAVKKTSATEFTEPEIKKTIPQPKPVQKQVTKQEKLEPVEKIPPQQKTIEPQKPSQPAQPKRNLIAMTKGFLDNLKDKGEDLLKRKGDDNKRPDFSEYKYLSYEARVSWQLQAAWKENAVSHQRPHEGKAAIEFVIDQNGNIADLKLLQSSGNRDLDTMILENTKRAAPFPPLPEHFKTQHYKTGRMIKVFANNYGF